MNAKEENIWSFLYFTGYLKTKFFERVDDRTRYSLVIPNKEIKSCYVDIIRRYFDIYKRDVDKKRLFKCLLERNPEGFAEQITELLGRSISYYDSTESFYYGLISGLLAGNMYYEMKSNRESGDGRYDLAFYKRGFFTDAIILEFKVCKKGEGLESAARRALTQINECDYEKEARELGYTNIIKYGIAFDKKLCYAIVE